MRYHFRDCRSASSILFRDTVTWPGTVTSCPLTIPRILRPSSTHLAQKNSHFIRKFWHEQPTFDDLVSTFSRKEGREQNLTYEDNFIVLLCSASRSTTKLNYQVVTGNSIGLMGRISGRSLGGSLGIGLSRSTHSTFGQSHQCQRNLFLSDGSGSGCDMGL